MTQIEASEWASLVAIGVGIGWLAGLSVSPVVAAVLGAVLAAIGAATGLRDSKAADQRPFDPRRIAVIVLALAVAAPLGITARTHRVFAPAVSVANASPDQVSGLFAGAVAVCDEMLVSVDEDDDVTFRSGFIHSTFPGASVIGAELSATQIRALVQAQCASY